MRSAPPPVTCVAGLTDGVSPRRTRPARASIPAEKTAFCRPTAIRLRGGDDCLDDDASGRRLRGAQPDEIGANPSEIRRMPIGRELFEKTA